MSEKYNTKQRQKILDLIQSQGVDFTAKDLYKSAGHEIGLTTIYRCIESLEAEGIILRLSQENNTARYQYVEPCKHSDHFYLKCNRCGKLTHIDCEKTAGLTEHIAKEHHFLPADTHIIISGHCASCTE